ncbi:hypothetical protein PV05_04113 [Exophiala xenobiotica]|uniref:Secreted protein n=1 Tax=Exophiala xenobiotica TaxID=348802 RepID=A0A0D2EVF7_9EURO|nr:uncharacterized protein PV05_04113 [Exophiala xenobiotica]KIW59678.1 hypothetical protein PV05_04113 [Exophiala xenobiotica]
MRLHATAVGIFVPFAVELVATRTTAVKLRPSSKPTRRLDKSCSPGTVDTVNTTYSTVYDSGTSDKSAVVGGAVGGRTRSSANCFADRFVPVPAEPEVLETNFNTLQQEQETAAQHSANEKAALQQQLDQQQFHYQQYQQQMQAPTYSAA